MFLHILKYLNWLYSSRVVNEAIDDLQNQGRNSTLA